MRGMTTVVTWRLTRLLAFLLAATALTFSAVSCGGGGDKSGSSSSADPETWAASVCGTLSTWTNEFRSMNQAARSFRLSSRDSQRVRTRLATAKRKLVAFFGEAKASTQKALDNTKAVGPPAAENGTRIQQDLLAGLVEARDTMGHAAFLARQLRTNDVEAFLTGTRKLASQADAGAQAANEHFKSIHRTQSDELDKAIKDEPSCQPFVSEE